MATMKKHVIMTATDQNFADFVVNHWFRSLKENVNLTDIDVVVFDYGLNEGQRAALKNQGVIINMVKKEGLVNNIRFKHMAEFLKKTVYDQIMSIDGGDVIFQSDISHLFEQDKDQVRVVCEDIKFPVEDYFQGKAFKPQVAKEIKDCVKNNPMINVGMILGPRKEFIRLCEYVNRSMKDFEGWGPDQLLINLELHKTGYVRLENGYNFVIDFMIDKIVVHEGKIYKKKGGLIPVVHNAGRWGWFRPIRNFGYGTGYNKLRTIPYFLIQWSLLMADRIKRLFHKKEIDSL